MNKYKNKVKTKMIKQKRPVMMIVAVMNKKVVLKIIQHHSLQRKRINFKVKQPSSRSNSINNL